MTTTKDQANERFVREFQRRHGLKEDGWAGEKTWGALGSSAPGFPRLPSIPQGAIDLMKDFEKFRPDAYRDPGSKNGLPITIGWGSTSDLEGKPIKLGTKWTRATADIKLAQDLDLFSRGVADALATAPTTDNQFGAMVSLAYNIGLKAFETSTLLRKHKAGDYAGAKTEFARWRFNDGREMAGLIRRRAAEAELYAR